MARAIAAHGLGVSDRHNDHPVAVGDDNIAGVHAHAAAGDRHIFGVEFQPAGGECRVKCAANRRGYAA